MDIIIFRKVFNNVFLNKIIFKFVHHILIDILGFKKTFKWNEVIKSRYILAGNAYLNHLNEYYRINNSYDLKFNRFNSVILSAIKSKSLDTVKYIIEELHYNYNSYGCYDNSKVLVYIKCDLLYIASKYGTIEIIQYIESLKKKDNNINNNNSNNNNYKSWNYIESFKAAAFSDDLKVLQYIYSKLIENRQILDDHQVKSAISNALSVGRIDFVKWLIPLSNTSIDLNYINFLAEAVKSGKLEVLQFCLTDLKPNYRNRHLISKAAAYGYLDIIKWLYENKISEIEDNSFEFASGNGHWKVIKWLYEKTPNTFNNKNTLLRAATDCQFDIYRQLFKENGFSTDVLENIIIESIHNTASTGNLEMLKWLHRNLNEGCTTNAMNYAAEYGHLEIVKWLHENRTESCTTFAMNKAAEKGHFEIIKWLHFNRTEGWTTIAMNKAAENGHFEIVKWLHENRTEGCTTNAMNIASENGHFEIIKWLHENRTEGCTIYAMNSAAWKGHLEIVKWLHENRTEGCTVKAMDWAAVNGHLEIIEWLHHNRTEGCTIDAINNAASYGYIEIIKWLHHNRTEGCTMVAMNNASKYGHFEIVEWLHHNRTEGIIARARENSIIFGHLDIVQWFSTKS